MAESPASIPPNVASSAAQAGVQSQELAKGRDAIRANASRAAARQVQAAERTDATVDTDDADTRVFTDAEGGGSQGRVFDDRAGDQQPESEKASDAGITRDEDGKLHLDIQA